MLYGVFFTIIGVALASLATAGGWWWCLVWPAISYLVFACAYFVNAPNLLGKREDGRLAFWSIVLYAPLLFCLWGLWYWLRLFGREEPHHRLLPDVVIGRRLLAGELPAGIEEVVDLTAEFPEPLAIREAGNYLAFPILDASAPDTERLLEFVRSLDNTRRSRYVHCAEGHGRTGLVAAALLLWRGEARSPDEAIARVRKARPRTRLNRVQRRALAEFDRNLCQTTEQRRRTPHP